MARKGLSAGILKLIALLVMTGDHIAWIFLDSAAPAAILLHAMGRLALPVFSFLLSEGFTHTCNFRAYAIRLGLFALISQLPFAAFSSTIHGEVFSLSSLARLNVLWSLFTALLALKLRCSGAAPIIKFIGIGALILVSLPGDGMFFPLLFVLVCYELRDRIEKRDLSVAFISLLLAAVTAISGAPYSGPYDFLARAGYSFAALFAVPLIRMYNGERGPRLKWFFYIYYPAHLSLLLLPTLFR